jgi:hypothetical protein
MGYNVSAMIVRLYALTHSTLIKFPDRAYHPKILL